ncbi:MAG: hypothetical protein MZW92_44260 [Comamonadaceae bacterium]|nr:hypothetical protein [Comamonadaceae bacterium]
MRSARARPSPTRRRCTRWCAGSASATATCRRAASAATPTSRCARAGAAKLGTRCEIKNLNSFRFLRAARSSYEVRAPDRADRGRRHGASRRRASTTPTATRRARCARKEDAQDYRYFPDPDLLPLVDRRRVDRARARRRCPSCPRRWRARFVARLRAAAPTTRRR